MEAEPQSPYNITQDKEFTETLNTGLADNTSAKQRTKMLIQECVLAVIEANNGWLNTRRLAGRHYPLKLLCEFTEASLDGEQENCWSIHM